MHIYQFYTQNDIQYGIMAQTRHLRKFINKEKQIQLLDGIN